MTKRHRLEDLGRLQEKISKISDHELFGIMDSIPCGRTKDFEDIFYELSDETKSDILHKIAYGIRDVGEMLSDCYCIAAGLEGDE